YQGIDFHTMSLSRVISHPTEEEVRDCHSEPERRGGEESRVITATTRFFVAEFTLSVVEGLLRMTPIESL
ncbi:MAG: hypothetical protein ACRERD_21275, partial [Candidatus Binatia bacterium]